MAHLGFDLNRYGTMLSRHRCDLCGVEFTVTPARPAAENTPCLIAPCESYDVNRDVDLWFGGDGMLKPDAGGLVAGPVPVKPQA